MQFSKFRKLVEALISQKLQDSQKSQKKPQNISTSQPLNHLVQDMDRNIQELTTIFVGDKNEDFIIRKVYIQSLQINATIIFIDGIVDSNLIEEFIIDPLTTNQPLNLDQVQIQEAIEFILPIKIIKNVSNISEIVQGINIGKALLLLENNQIGFLIDTTKVEHRNIEKPQNELTLKGPNEGFIESLDINKAIIRKQLHYEKLVSETVKIKNRASNTVTLMYVEDLVNKDVLTEIKKRLEKIEVDNIQAIALLEQYLEDRPYSLVPTILYSERPDRAVSFLLEGHVVVLLESSSACLIAPVTFWSFFHTAEDTYHRWFYGNFIRLIRLIAFIIATITPAFYVAATTFHVEMIPTDLALAIAAKRETVPFPAILEVLIMEISFELVREAGVRVPTPIGPTIGIVGALILGQAAVEANIISPIMVIVVSITGLASFAVPDLSFNFMIRIIRFVFLIFATFLGLFGIVICFVLSIAYMTSVVSFGVPFFSPSAPQNKSSKDLLFRKILKKEFIRPTNIKPQNTLRKSEGR